jgi:hypothetical protein
MRKASINLNNAHSRHDEKQLKRFEKILTFILIEHVCATSKGVNYYQTSSTTIFALVVDEITIHCLTHLLKFYNENVCIASI